MTKPIIVAITGASGAIYGLLLAFGVLYPNQTVLMNFLFPIRAKYLVMITAAIGLYFVPNLSMVAYALSITGIMVLTLAIGFVQTSRYLNQLDRDKDQ